MARGYLGQQPAQWPAPPTVTPPGPDGGGRRSKDWITYVTDDAGSGDKVIRRHVW
ncbi:hypothetical protein AB0I54_33290 [Streptomyces sp. NPDC050625]|uniref:hypothetical protein n=1 Tax=Streptomyces sp. NPDC050625 TaxID=3154629 RepID=UPI00343E7806